MTNIPTELLRTLVAVIDLRSFTKAAQSLGVTQPAVSAQIKRLQTLLGTELLDKSAPGVSLTQAGELVVNYARRLLSINDQILGLAGPHPTEQTMRIGTAGDFSAADVSAALPCFYARHPQFRFLVRSGHFDDLLRELREGELDLLVWSLPNSPPIEARHCWTEEMVWVRGPTTRVETGRPVPLVSYGEGCPFTLCTIAALNASGRDNEMVYVGSNIAGLGAAVAAGLGVMALPRNRANLPGSLIWEDAPLPRLPEMFCGIFVRGGADPYARNDLADTLASALRLHSNVTGTDTDKKPEPTPAIKTAPAG